MFRLCFDNLGGAYVTHPSLKYVVCAEHNSYNMCVPTDMLLGDSQRLSQLMSEWSGTTVAAAIQFVVCLKSFNDHEPEFGARSSGLVRVYHQLYGDYETYLSFIVTPATEASQLLQQTVVQLAPSEDVDDFQLVLKTGTRGKTRITYKTIGYIMHVNVSWCLGLIL